MKTCNKCGLPKPLTEFARESRNNDGLNPHCRECVNARKRAYFSRPEKLARRREVANDWTRKNAARLSEKHRAAYRADPEKHKAQSKRYRLRHPTAKHANDLRVKYGLSYDEYNRMLAEQSGVCALCKNAPSGNGKTGKVLHVDHNHETGQVRGLLCLKCNRALGMFGDDIQALTNAALYLAERDRSQRLYLPIAA